MKSIKAGGATVSVTCPLDCELLTVDPGLFVSQSPQISCQETEAKRGWWKWAQTDDLGV